MLTMENLTEIQRSFTALRYAINLNAQFRVEANSPKINGINFKLYFKWISIESNCFRMKKETKWIVYGIVINNTFSCHLSKDTQAPSAFIFYRFLSFRWNTASHSMFKVNNEMCFSFCSRKMTARGDWEQMGWRTNERHLPSGYSFLRLVVNALVWVRVCGWLNGWPGLAWPGLVWAGAVFEASVRQSVHVYTSKTLMRHKEIQKRFQMGRPSSQCHLILYASIHLTNDDKGWTRQQLASSHLLFVTI